jgi:hypothetical protein
MTMYAQYVDLKHQHAGDSWLTFRLISIGPSGLPIFYLHPIPYLHLIILSTLSSGQVLSLKPSAGLRPLLLSTRQ